MDVRPRGVRVSIATGLLALALPIVAAAPARADYVNDRLGGDAFWLPDHVRPTGSLANLRPRPEGRLRVGSKVRENVEIDADRGFVRVDLRYGTVSVGPEWVEDLAEASRTSARQASFIEWETQVRQSVLNADARAGQDIVSIELPVQFPESIANVIGQGARLNLSGSERITFSGTSTIIEGGPTFESGNPSAFPDLDMKQQLRVNLDGTVGEKIHVLVNHDSEVDTEFENKIRLRYDGEEDEVIQKIEMGNTDLVLPGAEFLSFRKSQQGLFGAKAEAKLGAMDFTVIASKQEGETASQRFVGRSRSDSVIVRDTDYVRRKYYWAAQPTTLSPTTSGGILPLGNFELFLDDKDTRNDIRDGARIGFAHVDPATGTPADTVGVHRGFYHRLKVNEDYAFNPESGAITLERALSRDHVLAAFYTFVRNDTLFSAGSLDNPDTLSLLLLAPPERDLYDPAKGFEPAKRLELKNVYFLGAQNIRPESFEMRVLRRGSAAGQQDEDVQKDPTGAIPNTEFVRILGLDYKGLTQAEPDLLVEQEYVDFEDGTITLPNPTPFAPDSSTFNVIVSPEVVSTGRSPGFLPLEKEGVPLLEYNSAIYEREPDDLLDQNKYLLEVKYTTPSPTYSLNRFNILEGSERVFLNGRQLTRGTDYDIDYDFGVLTFRTPDASLPDAEIEVDFEFVPLFGQAKESLVGLSGTYNFGPRTWLSSSWLFFTRATPEQRPKLGQEPSRILVGNLYGQWITNPGFMTRLVNSVPLVQSEDESELQILGEVAMSLPNPNTKGEIYIDDMEGVEDSRELSITRGVWVPASEPVGPVAGGLDRTRVPSLPFNWYNPENVVRRDEVFIELEDEREGQDFLQVLEFGVRPDAGVISSDPDSSGWLGILRNLSTIGEDFSEKKFLEIWVNDFGATQGTMVFDMGEISEDFYLRAPADSVSPKGRGFLDTEDVDPFDGELTVSREDFGLDNVQGDDEGAVAGDDGDDDFEFRRATGDFTRINNYEGNSLLDTEDLDDDAFLDTENAYLSYVVDLADTTIGQGFLAQKNFDPATRPTNHWRLYRMPLDDGEAVGGVPRRKSIKYVRLWFDSLAAGPGAKIQVASVKIVGAAWLEEKISRNDTVEPVPDTEEAGSLRINVVNNKEDVFYYSPFDPEEDVNNEERREQSLLMEYFGIPSGKRTSHERPEERIPGQPITVPLNGVGRQGSAYREILDTGESRSQDFTQYETLSFYVRDGRYREGGGLREGFTKASTGTFFFRFGPDTTNFYEFSTATLASGPSADWREIFIDLQPLTELKLEAPRDTLIVEGRPVEYRSMVVAGDTLAVYGAPSLARVRRLTVGVRGDDPRRFEVDGEIWVDEIRLHSVQKDRGYASRVTGTARFADLLTADGGARRIDSEFRRIEGDRTGSDEFSWDVRGDLKLNKFFDGLGVSLPVTGDYSFSESTPRLAPNSDVELVDEEDKVLARTTTRRQSVSSRFAKTRPSRSGFLRYSVDNISLSGSKGTTRQTSPFLVSDDEQITGQMTYNLNPGQGRTFRVWRFDMSYFPTLQMGLNGRQNFRESADLRIDALGNRIEDPREPVRTRALEGNLGVQWDPIRSNTFDSQFTFDKRQDLDLHKDRGLIDSFRLGGRELRRDHKTRASWRPSVIRWLRPVLSYDTSYGEDQSPQVQSGDVGARRLRRVENTNVRELSATISPRQIFKEGRTTPARATRGRETDRRGSAEDDAETQPPPKPGEEARDPGEDATAAPDTTSAPKERPSFGDAWRAFQGFARSFGDIRYTYRDSRSSRFSRVGDRPGFGYQFGFEEFDKSLLVTGPNLIEDNTSVTFASKLDTSFNPTEALYLDGAYSRSITRSVRNNTRNKTLEVTFPDLSVNLEGLEGTRLLQRLAKTSSINGAFRRQTSRSGPLPPPGEYDPPDTDWFDNETVRDDFTPFFAWNTNWNSGLNTTISYDRSRTVDESNFNRTISRTTTTAGEVRLNGRYSFSAPRGISFLGKRLRFRSDLTLSFDASRGEDKSEEARIEESGESTTTVRSHRKNMTIAPRATYNFSRKIQGSLDVSYGRSKDLQRDRTETTVSVAVEALISF
ncbi:MAG: T9SS outer membrane translocon Sov/SprA [Candidatus Eiseniibacteriota bacterium]